MPIYIPKNLKRIKGKPGIELLPLNVLLARFVDGDGKRGHFLMTAFYEPDLSSFRITGPPASPKKLFLKYPSRQDPRYRLHISCESQGFYRCRKYRDSRLVGEAFGPRSNWQMFFVQVGLIGLDNGEKCQIE
jgi:hypothetical protein